MSPYVASYNIQGTVYKASKLVVFTTPRDYQRTRVGIDSENFSLKMHECERRVCYPNTET